MPYNPAESSGQQFNDWPLTCQYSHAKTFFFFRFYKNTAFLIFLGPFLLHNVAKKHNLPWEQNFNTVRQLPALGNLVALRSQILQNCAGYTNFWEHCIMSVCFPVLKMTYICSLLMKLIFCSPYILSILHQLYQIDAFLQTKNLYIYKLFNVNIAIECTLCAFWNMDHKTNCLDKNVIMLLQNFLYRDLITHTSEIFCCQETKSRIASAVCYMVY